jgi:hypothetical protein
MFIPMSLWTLISSLGVALLDTGFYYYVLVTVAVISAMFFAWAGAYQVLYGDKKAIFSRLVLVLFGVVLIWAVVMMVSGLLLIDAEMQAATQISLGVISLVMNIILFIVMLFLPLFLLDVKPGKYYLISGFGKPDFDFVFKYIPLERERGPNDPHNPGALVSRGERIWIKPLDTARLIWDSQKKINIKETFDSILMQRGYSTKLDVKAIFVFDPQKITDASFSHKLSQKKNMDELATDLGAIASGSLYKSLRNFYYNIPYRQADSPQVVSQLALDLKQKLAWMESAMGLSFNERTLDVMAVFSAAGATAREQDYFVRQDLRQFNQMTLNAQRGDDISRYLLYVYLVEHPDLRYQFLPEVGNDVRLSDIDYLLGLMNQDARFRETVVYTILNTAYYANALPQPMIGGMLPSPGQQAVDHMPHIEHPELEIICTDHQTVLIKWANLAGEMYLHFDGQTAGPFYITQGSHDTGRLSVSIIEYTWNGQRFNLGSCNCQQPSAPPPNPPPNRGSRRRFGPSSPDTVETRRTSDGNYEPH